MGVPGGPLRGSSVWLCVSVCRPASPEQGQLLVSVPNQESESLGTKGAWLIPFDGDTGPGKGRGLPRGHEAFGGRAKIRGLKPDPFPTCHGLCGQVRGTRGLLWV